MGVLPYNAPRLYYHKLKLVKEKKLKKITVLRCSKIKITVLILE